MFNKKITSNSTSFFASISIIALLIILVPSILIVLAAFTLILTIIGLVLRFLISNRIIKTNSFYIKGEEFRQNENRNSEEIHKMKDVTNSIKPK
jgi:hypothetical protein